MIQEPLQGRCFEQFRIVIAVHRQSTVFRARDNHHIAAGKIIREAGSERIRQRIYPRRPGVSEYESGAEQRSSVRIARQFLQ